MKYGRRVLQYGRALRAVDARLRRIHAAGDPRLALADEALDEAAELARLTDLPADVRAAHALGWLHWCRYLADHENRDDLDQALVLFGPVFRARPSSVPPEVAAHYRASGHALAVALDDVESATGRAIARMDAYWQTGKLDELEAAVGYFRAALAAFPDEYPAPPELVSNLASAFRELFERTRRPEMLREAVELGRRALALVSPGHPDHTRILSNLGVTLQTLSEQTGDSRAAAEAVEVLRATVSIAGDDHPERAGYLSNLGSALRHLYSRTGEVGRLEEAVRVLGMSVQAVRPGEKDRHKALASQSTGLVELFTRTGTADYLHAGVAAARAAVAAVPSGHPDRAGVLATFGTVLRRQSEYDGQAAPVSEGIAVLREAVAATPAPHANRPIYLSSLANLLRDLFMRTGQTALLDQAVAAMAEAVELVPANHSARAAFLTGLSGTHLALFERTGRTGSLLAAVEASRSAVAAAESGHPDRALYLSNLGLALIALARHAVDPTSAAEAVSQTRQAVTLTPNGHSRRGLYQDNLGAALRVLAALNALATPEQADRLRQNAILADAVAAGRSAVAATPTGHFLLDRFRLNLAGTLLAQFENTGDTAGLTDARDEFMKVMRSAVASPRLRLYAYRGYAALPAEAGVSLDDALGALESAVELLPQAVPRWLTHDDRERDIGEIAGLPAQAAAVAVAVGKPVRAVELLEQTRGILVADKLNARSGEQFGLRLRAPALAVELETVRQRIATLDRDPGSWPEGASGPDPGISELTPEAVAAARQQADADWHDLLSRIRSVAGLRDFLRSDHIDRLAPAAAQGPVVFVYADQSRCGALVLTSRAGPSARSVTLPLTFGEAAERVSRFRAALDSEWTERWQAESEILDTLGWLWDRIAGPVLDDLNRDGDAGESVRPRLWWCPIGILSYLPLHAAGHHDDSHPGRRTVPDRVVSSYTPTARSLISARADLGRPGGVGPLPGTVIIAVPDAPGTGLLTGVMREASEISALMPGTRRLERPTRDDVLAALPHYGVAHFACHGATDLDDPSNSKLILNDHDTAPLTVGKINELELRQAELAYLSACETSITSIGLADESVHITAACYLAGYRQVIGTLWSITDRAGHDIAVGFYRRLSSDGTSPPDTAQAARTLNRIICDLRDKKPRSPSLWASHLHTGI